MRTGQTTLCRRPRSGAAGFTLIEVVISSALMALILASAYLCFNASIAGRKTMEPRLEVVQNARVALGLISADLRAACPLDQKTDFLGLHRMLGDVVADNIDFATHNHTPQHAREGDFCQLSYYLDRDPETGRISLWRRRNPTIAPDALAGGRQEEIASGVRGLRFEYSDGLDWHDTWGDLTGKAQSSQREKSNLSGLPKAVRITLAFDSEPPRKRVDELEAPAPAPPMVFQTVVMLNLADASANAGAGPGAASPGTASPEGAN